MSYNGTKIPIPTEHYTLLAEMAAAMAGIAVARGGAFTHPGDTIATILCEAWRAGEVVKMKLAMVSYMSGMLNEYERLQISPPSLADVLRLLPMGFNSGRYPDVDIDVLQDHLARDVPGMYGTPI